MRRRLVLPVAAVIAVAETYRRGYAAAVLYGARCWWLALHPETLPTTEADYMA